MVRTGSVVVGYVSANESRTAGHVPVLWQYSDLAGSGPSGSVSPPANGQRMTLRDEWKGKLNGMCLIS